MTDRERITIVNAYGDVIEGATAEKDTKSKSERSVVVSAPGYHRRYVFLDFNPRSADVVMLMFDLGTAKGPRLEEACEKNLRAAAATITFPSYRSGLGLLLMDAISRQQDRCYFDLDDDAGGNRLVQWFDRTGAWRSVPSGMHKPHEEGFEPYPDKDHNSWKTTRGAPDLQVTLWSDQREPGDRHGPPNYVAELDLDLSTGKRHWVEALKNTVTGSKTHPYRVNEALAWEHGVISFRLEAGK